MPSVRKLELKKPKILACSAALLMAALALAGCAGPLKLQQAIRGNTVDDISQTRGNRKDQLAQDFDRQRDDAQFDAAASSWERGDVEGCRKVLAQLLERNPNYRRARLMLADLYLFNGQAERSAEELNKALAIDPKDAMAHHSLAQVLDACGRRDEALAHYRLATQLDPNNPVYAQSCKFALELVPVQPPRDLRMVTNANIEESKKTTLPTSSNRAEPGRQLATELSAPAAGSQPPATSVGNSDGPVSKPIFAAGKIDDWVKPLDNGLPSGQTEPPHELAAAARADSNVVAASSPASPKQVQPASWNASDGKVLRPLEPTVKLASRPSQSDDLVAGVDNPQNRQSPLRESVVALAQGDTQGAIDAARRGLSETPAQSAALFRVLGAAYYRRGEFQTAQMELAQALSLDKTDALSYFLMSATLEKLNDREAAARFRAEAARLDERFRP